MIINNDCLNRKDINSKVHKVRSIIFDLEGKMYITNMNDSYNLPGGRVEKHESIEDALIRELNEELGINVLSKELQYIGNVVFWHKDFPGEIMNVNRENNVDLFLVKNAKEVEEGQIKLTNYEKHYHFRLMNYSLNEIKKLLKISNDNPYKRFTDVELETLIKEFEKFRGENNYVR